MVDGRRASTGTVATQLNIADSARFLRSSEAPARFSAQKKFVAKRLKCACTLAHSIRLVGWNPCAIFVNAARAGESPRALRYPEGGVRRRSGTLDGYCSASSSRVQPTEVSSMSADGGAHKRRVFHWPTECQALVEAYKQRSDHNLAQGEPEQRLLIARLAELSGNPRDACLRFMRHWGIRHKRPYREWTKREQQKLADLITSMSVEEAAHALGRSVGSVWSMLHRLGVGATQGRDWFTKFSLSRALHTRPEEIQKWIDCGWLKARSIESSGAKTSVIYSDDFCDFVKRHGREAVSRRLNHEALWFVQNYVFPPSHAELLDVRGTYTKNSKAAEPGENDEADSETET